MRRRIYTHRPTEEEEEEEEIFPAGNKRVHTTKVIHYCEKESSLMFENGSYEISDDASRMNPSHFEQH